MIRRWTMDEAGAHTIPYPMVKRFMARAYRAVHDKPTIHGLLEVDVTDARARIREHEARTGESISFTAFVSGCVAKAVDENKLLQAFRKGWDQLIVYDDVDVLVRIERHLDGASFVEPYILRAANRKTLRELHDEIRAVQSSPFRPVPIHFLPGVVQRPFIAGFIWLGRWFPQLTKHWMGTVGVTSVGMFGNGIGWGVPTASATATNITIGGIGKRQTREVLCLTVSVDHDIVDGAPAARFTQRLKELIEEGHGLADVLVRPPHASVAPNSRPSP